MIWARNRRWDRHLDLDRYRAVLHGVLHSGIFGGTRPGTDEPPVRTYFPLRCEDHRAETHHSALDVLMSWIHHPRLSTVAMTGEYGTGKTTTCIFLALRMLSHIDTGPLPIYVPVNRAASDEAPEAFLTRLLDVEYGFERATEEPPFIRLDRGPVCLILDGLEAPDDYLDHPVSRLLMSTVPQRSHTVLVSARRSPRHLDDREASAANPELRFDASVRVLSMDARDQRRYMEEIHGAGDPNGARAQRIVEALMVIQAQLDRPLLLELAMLAPRTKDGQLPRSLTALFELATRGLLSLDHVETDMNLSVDQAMVLLSRLALRLYISGEEEVDLNTGIRYVDRQDIDPRSVNSFLSGCRLFRDVMGRIAFAHRSLQEYFAAAAIRDRLRQDDVDGLKDFLVREPVLSMTVELLRSDPRGEDRKALLSNWLTAMNSRAAAGPLDEEPQWQAANVVSLLTKLGHSFQGEHFSNVSFDGETLRGAMLADTTFSYSDLSGVDLGQADISRAVFRQTKLRNAFFRNTSAVGARFEDCDFWNIRWVEEPPALWEAQWVVPGRLAALALSSGHIQLVPFEQDQWLVDQAVNIHVHDSGVLEIAISPHGDLLLASDRAGQLYCYRIVVEAGSTKLVPAWNLPSLHSGNIRRIRFTKDGRFYVTACRDGGVRVFSTDSRLPHWQHFRHQQPVMDAAWAPSGESIATAGYDGRICLFHVQAEQVELLEPTNSSGHLGIARAVSFSPSGHLLVAGDEEGQVTFWRATDTRFLHAVDVGSQVFAVSFLADDRVLVGTWSGAVFEVDATTREVTSLGDLPEVVRAIDSDGGAEMLVASWDGSLLCLRDGRPISRVQANFPDQADSGSEGSLFIEAEIVRPRGLSARQIERLTQLGATVTPG